MPRRHRVSNTDPATGLFLSVTPLSGAQGNPNHDYVDLALAPDGSAVAGFGGGGTQDRWVARRGPSPQDGGQPPVAFETPQQIDVRIAVTTSTGRRFSAQRRYRTCTPRARGRRTGRRQRPERATALCVRTQERRSPG